jgi:hypothetical protein
MAGSAASAGYVFLAVFMSGAVVGVIGIAMGVITAITVSLSARTREKKTGREDWGRIVQGPAGRHSCPQRQAPIRPRHRAGDPHGHCRPAEGLDVTEITATRPVCPRRKTPATASSSSASTVRSTPARL